MTTNSALVTVFLILFVQHMPLHELAPLTEDGEEWETENLNEEQKKHNTLGVGAAKVAYHLRENLLNLVGYLMYQNKIDTEPEIFYYMRELKMALDANLIDIFKIIPVLPELINKTLDQQMDLILSQILKECKIEFCQLKCAVVEWEKRAVHVSVARAFNQVHYNPFLKYILHDEEDVANIRELVKKLEIPLQTSRKSQLKFLSPHALKIFTEIKNKKTSLTPELLGYLLPFYPWPLDDSDVNHAISVITHVLIEERGYLENYKLKIRKKLIFQPMEMLARFMSDLAASDCKGNERDAANTLLQTLKYKMAFPDFRKFFRGVLVEVNRMAEVFNIINQENYPFEIVLARERVKRYVNKIIFYIDYKKFVTYKYKTKEEIIIAFIDFLFQEAPYPPIKIKLSMSALKAYVLFQTGPKQVSYRLLNIVIDAFLAPDLNKEIHKVFLKVKILILDESEAIMKILQDRSSKKCLDLLPCYFEIMKMLQVDSRLKEKLAGLEVPSCILRRFLDKQEKPPDKLNTPTSMSAASLLKIIDYDLFLRDAVLSAKQVREYIVSVQTHIDIKTNRLYCTKQETLLSYLDYLIQHSKYPSAIMASMKAIRANLKYEVSHFKLVTVKAMELMLQAWQSPFTSEEIATEMARIHSIIQANGQDVDEQLFIMDTSVCTSMLECYNGVVSHLNGLNPAYKFKIRSEASPELNTLNVGDLTIMSCSLIVDIVSALQTGDDDDSELEAAKAYLQDFDDDLDLVIYEIDCTGEQVYSCFDMILDKFRFELEIKSIQVNILQYLLKPTTCNERHCWWYLYEEEGSTILNPLLDYTRYLMTYYSINEAKSFHVQLDVEQINEYLSYSDLEETFNKLKVKVYSNNLEKIERFLLLLKEAHLLEDHVLQSVDNTYMQITRNQLPNHIHYGNLIYLKKNLKVMTTNKTVGVELDEIEIKIVKNAVKMKDMLKGLYVDCFTLTKCVKHLHDQMNTVAYNTPAARPIVELLNPYSCLNNITICPWIIPNVMAKTYIPEIIIPLIVTRLKNTSIDLIEKIVWKLVKEILESNPDMITIEIKPVQNKNITDAKILINFIDQVLEIEELPPNLKKYLAELLNRLKNEPEPLPLDVSILGKVNLMIAGATSDHSVLAKIDEIQQILRENEQAVDNFIGPIAVTCDSLKPCVQSIFDGLARDNTVSNIRKALMDLYVSLGCSKNDCSWRVTVDKKKATFYRNKLGMYLEQILGKSDLPFHIKLDLIDFIEYLRNEEVLKVINSVVFNAEEEASDIQIDIMLAISEDAGTPVDVKTSLYNILDYISTSQMPVYLHFNNLLRLTKYLKELTTSSLIKNNMDESVEYLKSKIDKVKLIMHTTPINCTSIESCLNTLYVGIKHRKTRIGDLILSMLKPPLCTVKLCPWIPDSLQTKIEQIEEALLAQMKDLQQSKTLSIHIKLDIQIIKKIVRACPDCLEKIPESALNDSDNSLVNLFLKTIDEEMAEDYEIQYVKHDLEKYFSTGELPRYMDVTTLTIFSELLRRMAKSDVVKMEIMQQRAKVEHRWGEMRDLMLNCLVRCVNVRKCCETMEYCLNEESVKDNMYSLTVLRLIRPIPCTSKTCPWLPLQNRKELNRIFAEIRAALYAMINDERVPFIIKIAVSWLLDALQLEPFERYIRGISKNNPSKLMTLLQYIRKDKRSNPHILLKRSYKVLKYLMSRKVPNFVVGYDLPDIVKWLMNLSKRPDVEKYMESALNIVTKKPSDIDKLFKKCPVSCLEIYSCMETLTACLQLIKSDLATSVIRLLLPPMCTKTVCPWIRDKHQSKLMDKMSTNKNRKVIYPDEVIVFFSDDEGLLNHVTLRLHDRKTADTLEALTLVSDTKLSRQTAISIKGSSKKRIIDFSYTHVLLNIGLHIEPEVNFAKADSIIICVPFKSGQVRPLKFDLKKPDTHETLRKISRQQSSLNRGGKSSVTLVDLDDTRTNFTIDVLDGSLLRRILEQTIDEIIPIGYKPVFFWPGKNSNESWGCAIIQEKSPLEVYLRNMPGRDFANEETPVVITSDGIITMDFDVNDQEIVANIETSAEGKTCNLDIAKHKKYTFYIPIALERNMASVSIDFSIPGMINTLIQVSLKYPNKAPNPTLLIEDMNGLKSPVYFNFYKDIYQQLFHATYFQIHKPTNQHPLNFVIIPISADETIVLDLNNPKVRDLLLKQFADMIYTTRLMIIHVPDNQGITTPIGVDPDDSVTVMMLKSLSEKTLTPTRPILGVTENDKTMILVIVNNESFKAMPIIIEDNRSNKRFFESLNIGNINEEMVTLDFSAGAVLLSKSLLVKFARDLPKIQFTGPNYIGTTDINFHEIILPVEYDDKLYYATITPSKHEVMEFLKRSSESDNTKFGIIFTLRESGRISSIILPIHSDNVASKVLELATRLEIQQRPDTVMIILAKDTRDVNLPFILDLSNSMVLEALQNMEKNVNPKSDTKGLFHYVDKNGKIIPIILDYSEYDYKLLSILQQATPLELRPLHLPNTEATVPLIAFLIKNDETHQKEGVVLNPADSVVRESLQYLSNASAAHTVKFTIQSEDGEIDTIYIDRSNNEIMKELIYLSCRTVPFKIPVKPIPLDGSSIITVNVRKDNTIDESHINTRDEKSLKLLLDSQESLPFTEPQMVVLGPDGEGLVIRIDTRSDYSRVKENIKYSTDGLLVINPESGRPVVVDVANPSVSQKLMELNEINNRAAQMIVFSDSDGQVEFIRLNTKNRTVIDELWVLQQHTTPSNLAPFIVVPNVGAICWVFTVIDEYGENRAIILDVTNTEVRNELIQMWDTSTKGIPLTIKDYNNNLLTMYFDISSKSIVRKLSNLMMKTMNFDVPLVSGGEVEKKIVLKIPFRDENGKFLITCNISNPTVIDDLLKIPGRSRIGPRGAAFTFKNRYGDLSTMYLDLNNSFVLMKLQKVCPDKMIVLNPTQTLIVDAKNQIGERTTNVLNLDNPTVLNELKYRLREIYQLSRQSSHAFIDIPIVDSNGVVTNLKLDTKNSEMLSLLEMLSRKSLNRMNLETFIISEDNYLPNVMVIFSASGPLLVDQSNVELVNSLLVFSTPYNPKAVKITFGISGMWTKTGYFDINDKRLAAELKKVVDQHFKKNRVIPPLTLPEGDVVKVPCRDREGRSVLYYLDIRNHYVVHKLKEQSMLNRGNDQYNMRIITLKNGIREDIYKIDTNNVNICEQLEHISFFKYYIPEDGSLLIMNLPNKTMPVIILDMHNAHVISELLKLSEKTNLTQATHVAIYRKEEMTKMIKLNVKDGSVVSMLINLVQYTPIPMAPITMVNPYGRHNAYVAFTTSTSDGRVRHILLNMDNPEVTRKIDELTVDSSIKKPLQIAYETSSGQQKQYVLDAMDDSVISYLDNLGRKTHGLTDAIVNMAQKNVYLEEKLLVPMENKDGSTDTYRINPKYLLRWGNSARRNTKISAGLIVYLKDNGQIRAFRVNPELIPRQYSVLRSMALMLPKYVLILTFKNEDGTVKLMILNTMNEDVVKALVEITYSTPLSAGFSTATIRTANGDTITIRINLNDMDAKAKLEVLLDRTPKPIAPIVISSPFGPKPMLVLSIEGFKEETVPILIDMNNDEAVKILDSITESEDRSDTWVVKIPGASNKLISIYVNPYKPKNKRLLMQISQLTGFIPAPITLHGSSILTCPLPILKNAFMNVPLNTTDKYIINALIDIMKAYKNATDRITESIKFYLEDGQGNRILIILDLTFKDMTMLLLELGSRVAIPSTIRIKPNTGSLYLFITVIPVLNDFIPVTFDLNNPLVVSMLEIISEPVKTTKEITTVHFEFGEISFEANIRRRDFEIRDRLLWLTNLSPTEVCPSKIIPAGTVNPLISIVVQQDNNKILLVINLNKGKHLRKLFELGQVKEEGLTSIEYIKEDGHRDNLCLNLSNPNVVFTIRDLYTDELMVYLAPRRTGNPIIIIKENQKILRIDPENAQVLEALDAISDTGPDRNKKTLLEIKSEQGFTVSFWINFSDPSVRSRLEELEIYTELPQVKLNRLLSIDTIIMCPVIIVPPNGKYPLLMIELRSFVTFTFDINEPSVLRRLLNMEMVRVSSKIIVLEVPDGEGNSALIKFDLSESTYNRLRNIPRHLVMSFKVKQKTLPVLVVKVKDRYVELDLNDPLVIDYLKTISKPSPDAYKIQIPLPEDNLLIHLLIEDVLNMSYATTSSSVSTLFPSTVPPETLFTGKPIYTTGTTTSTTAIATTSPSTETSTTTSITTTRPKQEIYWITLNLTNMLTHQTYMYVFDISMSEIVISLKEYSLSVPKGQHVFAISLALPEGSMILRINLYDSETFKLFTKLTIMSTGKPPVFVGTQHNQIWWNFTVTDYYNKPIKIELDVNNENIVKKIKELSDMFIVGRKGTIIKGQTSDGREFQLLLDLACPATLKNLFSLAEESKGGKSKPLKPLCPYRPPEGHQFMKFDIKPPGLGKKITIEFDVNDPDVISRLLEIDKNFVPGGSFYSLKIRTKTKLYKIKLNLADKDTLMALIQLSKDSSGVESLSLETQYALIQRMYTPNLITTEIKDGREVLPITIDVSDKFVVRTLEKIQLHNSSEATIYKFKDDLNRERELAVDINNREVINMLLAVGVPTISPREVIRVKLYTFILVKKDRSYTALKLDLSDRMTVILFLDLVRQYSRDFTNTRTIEIRDDNGQYIGVDIDLDHELFMEGLTSLAHSSKHHQIKSKNSPFLVFCLPSSSETKRYEIFKIKFSKKIVNYFKHLPAQKSSITIHVIDAGCKIRLNPDRKDFLQTFIKIPNIAYIQRYRANPLVVIYVKSDNQVDPIYLSVIDSETVNKLIELHNDYALSFGRAELSVIKIVKADGSKEYLLIHLNDQKTLNTLSKLSVLVGNHYFVRQRIEKLVMLKIPLKHRKYLGIRLNIADPDIVNELVKLSETKAVGKYVFIYRLKDAFGLPLKLKFDFNNPETVSALMKLSDN